MKISLLATLGLLCVDHFGLWQRVQVKAQAQEDRNQDRRRQRQRRQQQQQQQQQQRGRLDANNDGDKNESFEYVKEKFSEFFQGGDETNSTNPNPNLNSATQMNHRYGPKHIVEGMVNTLFVSGSAALLGVFSLIGIPILTVFGTDSMRVNGNTGTGTDTGTNSDDDQQVGKFARFLGGGIVGGLFATGFWIVGTIFGLWQLIAGLIATPKTLWAWIQGRVYWNTKTSTWKQYNLTQHAFDLLNANSYTNADRRVQDDSLYQLLQIETTATSKEIKRAYYKLAKEYHPDKHANNEELFLKVHTAYETLYDPEQRKLYDEWGRSSDSSSSQQMPNFDAGIFFDVLFGVSSELEPYIGDLAIKSFSSQLMQVIIAAQSVNDDDNGQKILQDLFQAFFTKGGERRESRQVDIALHLQDFAQDFVVHQNQTHDEFEIHCQTTAQQLMDSTPFSIVFVEAIGTAMYWEGIGSFQNPILDVPTSLMAWTRDRMQGMKGWTWFGFGVYELIQEVRKKLVQAEELIAMEHSAKTLKRMDEAAKKKLQQNKAFELLIPSIMGLVWKYNQQDIAKTIKAACWKLLHSNTYEKSKHRRRQAQALKIMGREFSRQAKLAKDGEQQVCDNDNDNDNDTDADADADADSNTNTNDYGIDDQVRIEVALQMATMKDTNKRGDENVAKNSETLIQENLKKKEEEEVKRQRRATQRAAREKKRERA